MGRSWRIGIDDAPTDLVTNGLFRWSRHPIYAGILAALVGVVLMTPSPCTIGGLVIAHILIPIQSRLEDAHMHARHGEAFAIWACRVGRFVPWLGRVRGAAS